MQITQINFGGSMAISIGKHSFVDSKDGEGSLEVAWSCIVGVVMIIWGCLEVVIVSLVEAEIEAAIFFFFSLFEEEKSKSSSVCKMSSVTNFGYFAILNFLRDS